MDVHLWIQIFTIGLLIYLAYIFLSKKTDEFIGEISLLKDRVLVFATPKNPENLLLIIHLISFFIADLAQNQFLARTPDYRVTVFWQTTALAQDVWFVFMVIFQLTLFGLFLLSLQSKDTHRIYDLVFGLIGFFAFAILVSGVMVQIHGGETVRYFFTDFRPLDFYHIGVYAQMITALYYAFTR